MNEHEVEVSDSDETEKILFGLGLAAVKNLRKHRTSFTLDNFHFDIDEYLGIPTFMEIEAPSEGQLFEMITKLNFPPEKVRPWSSKELFEHYGKT